MQLSQFRCPECLAGFTRADNLKRHFKILHEGAESYICPHCNKSFARKNTLQRHVASQHTREKKYGCDYCDKTFIYSFEVIFKTVRYINKFHCFENHTYNWQLYYKIQSSELVPFPGTSACSERTQWHQRLCLHHVWYQVQVASLSREAQSCCTWRFQIQVYWVRYPSWQVSY